MQKVVFVFVGVLLAAGVAGAQELPYWCEETPCARFLAPEEGDTVNPETTFLVEVILTPDLSSEGAECFVVVALLEPDDVLYLRLLQHRRPRGDSPVFYRVDFRHDPEWVMEAIKPLADVGDYLPNRFRILGELHLEPGRRYHFYYFVGGPESGCGDGNAVEEVFSFHTSSP